MLHVFHREPQWSSKDVFSFQVSGFAYSLKSQPLPFLCLSWLSKLLQLSLAWPLVSGDPAASLGYMLKVLKPCSWLESLEQPQKCADAAPCRTYDWRPVPPCLGSDRSQAGPCKMQGHTVPWSSLPHPVTFPGPRCCSCDSTALSTNSCDICLVPAAAAACLYWLCQLLALTE